MNQHQTDSVHAAEQTPTTQPADEAVAALTDEELEQAAGGARGLCFCPVCGMAKKYPDPNSPCQIKSCPSNQ